METVLSSNDIKITGHHINGGGLVQAGAPCIEVHSPLDGTIIGRVPVADNTVVNNAVHAASEAFSNWSETPLKDRVQVLFRFKQLVENDISDIADLVSRENGKTHGEAKAEIEKGLEVTEFATSLPQIYNQELLEVSRGVDCMSRRYPLGIVAGITPFNFPAMVPLWMIPIAIGAGNTFIHKPSEQVPLTPVVLADYLQRAGLPKGIYNIVHGYKRTVEAIIDQQAIKAIGFVGSSAVAKLVYQKGTLSGPYSEADVRTRPEAAGIQIYEVSEAWKRL